MIEYKIFGAWGYWFTWISKVFPFFSSGLCFFFFLVSCDCAFPRFSKYISMTATFLSSPWRWPLICGYQGIDGCGNRQAADWKWHGSGSRSADCTQPPLRQHFSVQSPREDNSHTQAFFVRHTYTHTHTHVQTATPPKLHSHMLDLITYQSPTPEVVKNMPQSIFHHIVLGRKCAWEMQPVNLAYFTLTAKINTGKTAQSHLAYS